MVKTPTMGSHSHLHLRLRSRHAVAGPLGFVLALPVWIAMIGLLLTLGLWFWTAAINIGAVSAGARAAGAGADGKTVQQTFLRAGLAGLAEPYVGATHFSTQGRAVLAEIDQRSPSGWPAPSFFVVQARSLARQEGFNPRPPQPGEWE